MLTEREKEILRLACLGNKQIGERLGLSAKTVERYFADMYAKTHTARRTELLVKAIRNGVIEFKEVVL